MKNIVAQINNQLRKFGADAIQKAQIPGRGTVIGYKPQYILDAINAVLGPENWRYEVVQFDITKGEKLTSVWVLVSLWIKAEEGWINKGQHFGHAFVTMGAIGDALKAATTDALGKVFSTMSVGRDAYAGILARNGGRPLPVKDIPEQSAPASAVAVEEEPAPVSSPGPDPAPPVVDEVPAEEIGIAPIPGVRFIVNPDLAAIVADETEKGAIYKSRNLLKDAGFKWDRDMKVWFLPFPTPTAEEVVDEGEPEAEDEGIPF